MATVFIPTMMARYAPGVTRIEVAGGTVAEIVAALEARFPGIEQAIIEDDRLVPGLAVAIDGEVSPAGLRERVGPRSEVHFLPAIAGG